MIGAHCDTYKAVVDGNHYYISDNYGAIFTYDDLAPYTGTINIPASIEYRGKTYEVVEIDIDGLFYGNDITAVNVAEDNKAAASIDGCLYSKDRKELLFIPSAKTGTLALGPDVHVDGFALEAPNSLSSFEVSDGNSEYKSRDGLIYSKDGTRLLRCPGRLEGECHVAEGVESIGSHAFAWCAGVSAVELPPTVRSMGNSAFRDCKGLSSVVVPEGVGRLSAALFEGCDNLSHVALPESLDSIASGAFSFCKSLQVINIPAGVRFIDDNVFDESESLETINVAEGNATYKSVDGVLLTKDGTTMLRCPEGKSGNYDVPDGVVRAESFSGCRRLVSVSLPSSTNHVGSFMGCESLESIRCFSPEPFPIMYGIFYGTRIDTYSMVLYVPQGSYEKYRAANVWNFFIIKEFDTTGIVSPTDGGSEEIVAGYSLDGRRSDPSRKGVNIIKTADGKVRKVIVR